jgi:hypothetical protein
MRPGVRRDLALVLGLDAIVSNRRGGVERVIAPLDSAATLRSARMQRRLGNDCGGWLMRQSAARVGISWLALVLLLVFVPAAQARPAKAQTSAADVRTAVGNGFTAINAANKKLYACKWGHCTEAAAALRATAQQWLAVLQPMKADTKTISAGLKAATTSLQYWNSAGLDAIRADAAARDKSQNKFDGWYRLYKKHYKLGVKFQNRAVNLLS